MNEQPENDPPVRCSAWSGGVPVGLEMVCSNDTKWARDTLLRHLWRTCNERGNTLVNIKFRKTETLLIVTALEVPPKDPDQR